MRISDQNRRDDPNAGATVRRSTYRLPRSGLVQWRLCRCRHKRHRFAVRTLLDAYEQGADPQARLALLSTYLGHVDPKATYWYLSAAPELLKLAGDRLQDHLGGAS